MPSRHELETVYHVNGVAYVLTRDCILEQKNRMGQQTGAVVIEDFANSIDTLDDFALVEAELDRRKTS
jgi:CMP-N-acetylneuraminic acid synthetase